MDDQNGHEHSEVVRNSESTGNMEANTLIGDTAEEDNQKKRIRHRRKKVYENIRSRMEFYFSDANLAKDRFLSKLIEDNPEVDIAVFLSFNKIRTLTDSVKHIKKALKHSELLSVSEDGTKVFRTKPIQLKENEEECTIYVEKLPLEADHDWLKQVFSQYGTVDYVSIPKYKNTGKIKGFAFVEFHTPEEAKKTLEAFGAVGCCLSSNIEPEQLCSILTFQKEQNGSDKPHQSSERTDLTGTEKNEGKQGRLKERDDIVVVESEEHEVESEKSKKTKKKEKQDYESTEKECSMKEDKKQKRKRKHAETAVSIDEEGEEPSDKTEKKSKKKQKQVDDITNNEMEDSKSKDEKKRKKKQKYTETTVTSDHEEEGPASKDDKKGKRKRKHSEPRGEEEEEDVAGEDKKKKQTEIVDAENNSPDVEKSSKRKRQMEGAPIEESSGVPEKKAKTDSDIDKEQDTDTENSAAEDEVHKKKKSRHRKKKKKKQIAQEVSSLGLQVLSKTEWKSLRNRYLNLQRVTMNNLKQQLSRTRKWNTRGSHTNGHSQHDVQIDEAPGSDIREVAQTAPRFTYTPGVIIRVGLDAPVTDLKNFKIEAKALGDIEYVDVKEGATEAFLRCSTSEAANKLVSSKHWENMDVLEGEADKQYWGRIREERQKMTCQNKAKKRGRNKLLERAEKALGKHIKFDEVL